MIEQYKYLTNINDILYSALINLNKYLDADNIYDYLKNIKENKQEFLDIFYENILTNYVLNNIDTLNISQFNTNIENTLINIANKIINEK